METLGILLIIAILGSFISEGILLIIAILESFISDLIASITVYIMESYQTYKQKRDYIRARRKK